MILNVQVIDNYEEYIEELQKLQIALEKGEDYPKPVPVISYNTYNIADQFIDAYKGTINKETGNKEIIIFTCLQDLGMITVDYDRDTEKSLEKVISTKNNMFYDQE